MYHAERLSPDSFQLQYWPTMVLTTEPWLQDPQNHSLVRSFPRDPLLVSPEVMDHVSMMESAPGIGYDADKDEIEVDMVKRGIVDPLKVTKAALQNAASIANMILTTEALVTDIPEKEKAPAMPPGGGYPDY